MNRAQKKLQRKFFSAGINIMCLHADRKGENRKSLERTAEEVRALRAELDDTQYAEAFDHSWSHNMRDYESFWKMGIDPQALRGVLWRWALDLESPSWDPYG